MGASWGEWQWPKWGRSDGSGGRTWEASWSVWPAVLYWTKWPGSATSIRLGMKSGVLARQ